MKDTFNKVVMDEERKEEMRAMLGAQKVKKSKRRTWIPALAAVAALVAVLVAVPFTRNMIVSAAEALGFKRTKSGMEISATSSVDTENSIYFFEKTIVAPDEADNYAQTKDGKLYYVIDGEWNDVTDQCSETEYYRKETTDQDGDKVVVYVGGTPDCKGSLEFTYDKDGKLFCLYGSVDSYASSWIEAAFSEEGLSLYDAPVGYVMFKDDEGVGGGIMMFRTDDMDPTDGTYETVDGATVVHIDDDATAST